MEMKTSRFFVDRIFMLRELLHRVVSLTKPNSGYCLHISIYSPCSMHCSLCSHRRRLAFRILPTAEQRRQHSAFLRVPSGPMLLNSREIETRLYPEPFFLTTSRRWINPDPAWISIKRFLLPGRS